MPKFLSPRPALAVALAGLLASAAAASPAHADAPAAPAYTIVDHIAGADGGWDYASLDVDAGRVYVARSNAVMAIDIATHKVTNALAPANGAHAVFGIDGGRTVVETDGHTGLTRFIDAATGHVVAEVATGKKPDAALFEPTSGRVVVMSPGSGTVSEIDPATHQVVASLTIAGGLEAADTDGKGHVFANLEEAGGLVEIDAVAGKLMRSDKLTGCEGPTGLALVAGGMRAISACANGVAAITDTGTGKLLGLLAIDKGPDSVLVDEARHLAFIPCGGSGTLVAVATDDPNNIRVVGRIPTQMGARTGALDPRDGHIYLPTASFGPPAPGAKHGALVPGSFVVLVLAPKG